MSGVEICWFTNKLSAKYFNRCIRQLSGQRLMTVKPSGWFNTRDEPNLYGLKVQWSIHLEYAYQWAHNNRMYIGDSCRITKIHAPTLQNIIKTTLK